MIPRAPFAREEEGLGELVVREFGAGLLWMTVTGC
jgi:hypothetical protein